ncbi:MAG: hypothetical protein OER86_01995 [Phycisphaerae bacterium]|nr:hypothetical protein [Phycisphaerae bacterium]
MDSIPVQPPVSMSALRPLVCGVAILFLGGLVVGCEEEPITSYRVPSTKPPASAGGGEAVASKPQRVVAAIVSRPDRTWFIKLSGTREEVAQAKGDFDAFVGSLRFQAGDGGGAENPVWDTPSTWHEHRGSGMRVATFHVQGTDHKLTISVIALGGTAGGLLANINRWRGQIGLEPVEADALADLTQTRTINGVEVILVDMGVGAEAPGTTEQPGSAPTVAVATQTEPAPAPQTPASGNDKPRFTERQRSGPISYQVSTSWKQAPSGGMRVAAFSVVGGGEPAVVTVIPLGGGAGGALSNYNRWRRQVGLGPATQAEYEKAAKAMAVDSIRSSYVDVVGPEAGGDQRPRILAVSVPRESRMWFFKMTGPAKLLEKEKSNFERFVQSVRFEKRSD